MELLEYKCPCCGGAIQFDSNLQKMKCPYCDTEFDVETLRQYDESLKGDTGDDFNWKTDGKEQSEWTGADADGMCSFICNSCGGEIIGDANTAATSCPFCGNPVVMKGRLSGALKPDLVIPFKLDKEAAKEGLKKHLSGKKLLPDVFSEKNHIDEIKGIYVPFWLFDAEADADMRYRATRVRTWADSRFFYTETQFFSVERGGMLDFADVPADGSSKLADDLMESIEPYDMTQAVDFQTAYLAGYLADKYDVNADSCVERTNARVRKSTEQAFAATVNGYVTVVPEYSSIRLNKNRVKYALLPVWLLNTTWNGNRYTFAMNGQTGKFVGNLPADDAKKWKYFGIYAGIGAAVAFALGALAWLVNLI